MLSLGKERFIGNIALKFSFQMALLRVKNLAYNKMVRQNIFCFINSISILLVLTNCYHCSYYYSPSSYYHCFYYFIIILTIFYCYHSHHYFFSSYYRCYLFYFISFYFLLFILLWFLSACYVWRVCVTSYFYFFLFFSMIYILYSECSFITRINHFFVIIVYIIIVITITFYFLQHYHSLGENSAYEFEQPGLPLPTDYFG